MLTRLLWIRYGRALKDQAVTVHTPRRLFPGVVVDAGWLGLTVRGFDGDVAVIVWDLIERIESGPGCVENLEGLKAAMAKARDQEDDLRPSRESGDRDDGKPGLTTDEIEAILREHDGTSQ